VAGSDLRDLLLLIADQTGGFDVASEILYMRIHSDRSAEREHDPELLQAGRKLLKRVRFKKGNRRCDYNLAGIARACLTDLEGGPIAAEVARRLRQAVATWEISAFDNNDLLKALLAVQPRAVLDALFEGTEREQRAGVRVFDHLREHRANPADAIPCEALIAWCDLDPETRYLIAASIVAFARHSDDSGPRVWSEQSKALLASTPDPKGVLAVLVKRFRLMAWSGSRAAVIEANARLLDSLNDEIVRRLGSTLDELKDELAQEIESERRRETERDSDRDERFE
jgi:hypothetical protein